MKHTILASAAGLSVALAAATPSFAATVSTAFGNGADAQLAAQSLEGGTPSDQGSNGVQVNSRFNVDTAPTKTSNNDIIALRFDLSGYDLSTIADVSLSLFSFRDDGSNRSIQVYGVTPFATGKDNNGTIAGFNTTNWDEATVKFSTMPGLEWDDVIDVNDFDLDTANTTLLGSATFTGAELGLGTTHTITGASFASFIQTHTTTNLVTLIIRAGNTSTGQARFATKEATALDGGNGPAAAGTYAPYLTFTADLAAVPEPSAFAALVGAAGLAFAASRRRRSA